VLNENVNLEQANLEATLQMRFDSINGLVKIVKGSAEHVEKVVSTIADSNIKLAESIKSHNMSKMEEANNELITSLNNFYAVVQDYPTITASENFLKLQDELEAVENEINTQRKKYNEVVTKYNIYVQDIPIIIFAKLFGFEVKETFEADEAAYKPPVIEF
jgi:LemA protein